MKAAGQAAEFGLGRSFGWLNTTQFLGALNDNLFKLVATFFLIRHVGTERAAEVSGLGGMLFALPFILFLPAAGVLADRYRKSAIVVWAKAGELAVMGAAALSFWLAPPWAGFVILFLMSTQSALFGPTKYGIVPELVERHQLSRANGYLVALTYLAIILGTVAAPWLTEHWVGVSVEDRDGGRFARVALVCVAVAALGLAASFGIRRTTVLGTRARISPCFWRNITATLRANRHDGPLMLALFGSAYFSLIGAFIQFNLIPYGIEHLGITETQGGYLFLFAALGIGAGSVVAGRLSGRNVEFGLVPVGALLIALASTLLYLLPPSVPLTRGLMLVAGMGAGLYIIPVEAFIQYRAPRDQMGEVIAANGFLSWLGVLGAGLLVLALSQVPGWQPAHTFGVLGVLTLAMTVFCLIRLPDFLVRFIAMLLTRSVYRIRVTGLEHLPVEGGALLVANHVSTMDALLVLAVQQRRIRFLMARSIYERHPLRRVFRLMRVIPIADTDGPRALLAALEQARAAMAEGYIVGLFAEGALTRNGQMRAFKGGVERLMKGRSEPIIPLHIGGVWGSRFSHYRSVFRGEKAPLRWRYPVTLTVGAPLPADTPRWKVHQAVRVLAGRSWERRRGVDRSVARVWLDSVRRHWRRPAADDTTGRALTYGRMGLASWMLSRRLRHRTGAACVGVLLPPSVGGALTNLALILAGKVPVNLNLSASQEAVAASIRQAGIDTVVTVGAVLDKFPGLPLPDRIVRLEQELTTLTTREKLGALFAVRCAPLRWLAPAQTRGGEETLTVMFSSGTTGAPKGVVLTHHNILSNVEQVTEVFCPDGEAHLAATLPLFHSFGFTAGIMLPLLSGMRVSYHTSPLEPNRVVELIRTRRCNTLFTTPSFLATYLRAAERDDVASLRFVAVGAEKLKAPLADAFAARFGFRPLEGYGATEMAPVVALNLPEREEAQAFGQDGARAGSVGQPLPGVAARVTDLETGAELPPGEAGMLWLHGPNRMAGYLGRDDLTAEVLEDGWYRTGDVARIDEDGFIHITDRLARFSKIGGEMVPHLAIEDYLLARLPPGPQTVAVTAVPDDRKGERLVLLHTAEAGDAAALSRWLDEADLPNLWKPHVSCFFQIEALPFNAAGKLELARLKAIAAERMAARPGRPEGR